MHTLYNDTLVREALLSAARTNGTANGSAVDLNVFANNFRTALVIVSTATITDGSHAISVEDSDDGSTGWAAVATSRIQGSLPTVISTSDDTFFFFGVAPLKRYFRVVATTTGATTGGVFSAKAILGAPSQTPPNRS